MTGNSPFSSLWTSIWIPSIEPENVRPPIPWIPVTLADRVRTKLPGSEVGSPFGHWMPISLMWTGSQDGQAKLSPVAPPTERKMPKPGRALNEPLPRNSKLRASPAMSRPATASSALIEVKLTSGSVGPAPVLILRFSALRTRKAPNLTSSSSALNRKDEKLSPEKTKVALRPILSASGPSVISPLIGLLGRKSALSALRTRPVLPSGPPLNWACPLSNVTLKSAMPRLRLWKLKMPGL